MAPIDPRNVSSLSEEELSEMLKGFGVDVGPINVATRRTYERYLIKLQTGQASPPSKHEPADNDEDEDTEVILKQPPPQQQMASSSQPRQRHHVPESHIPTPKGDSLSRPTLSSAKKTTSAAFVPYTRPSQSAPLQQQQQSTGGIPGWVKLTAVAVFLVLAYLIYINMEPNAVSNIPSIPNKVQV
ncbi:hypothetical protein EGW08_018713 [Elysia chlorotica]|uniref:LEM domain-containing protein n=1 Tax=Elysia chlorotica TaxID=188477 RepID=A0A3S1B6W8_ELYCH|nr:hypothetical protein EGW08_018713 [Elysia chlorotica]